MFKWGILSAAKIAREHVLPAISESQNSFAYAIASRDLSRAQSLADHFQIPKVYDSYDALISDPDIDGVYIPVATSLHAEWTEKAARAGKHVLCEKPIGLSAADIDPLIRTRDDMGVMISEAFMVTYHPQWHKVRDLLQDRAIGKLIHIQGAFSFHNTDPDNTRNQVATGGGALPDIGVYPTITSRFATQNEPYQARADITYSPQFKTDIFCTASLRFDGFSMDFYVSTQLALHQTMVFHGERGFIKLNAPFNADVFGGPTLDLFHEDTHSTEQFSFGDQRQYRRQIESFVAATNDRNLPHVTLENSRANQAVLDAIYRSDKSGNWEDV